MTELEFLGNEIVFIPPREENKGFDSGQTLIKQAEIKYVGKSAKLGYQPGDKFLYEENKNLFVEKELLGTKYLIASELAIICRVR